MKKISVTSVIKCLCLHGFATIMNNWELLVCTSLYTQNICLYH